MPDNEELAAIIKSTVEPLIKSNNESVLNLVTSMIHSLEAKMDRRFDEVDRRFDEVLARFDNQSTRLDRHAALLQTGSRWTNRMNSWAERIDAAIAKKDQQLADLARRIDRLESGSK